MTAHLVADDPDPFFHPATSWRRSSTVSRRTRTAAGAGCRARPALVDLERLLALGERRSDERVPALGERRAERLRTVGAEPVEGVPSRRRPPWNRMRAARFA
ncbi:MAG: hypothetical protein R2862_08000 [Thermoanaerobaculia bacterium]